MHRFRATALLIILAALIVAPRVHASDIQEVLGATTSPSDVVFPGLSSGPGFILPDSKLYPLDQFVQELRLLVAFTPEQQARVHMNIAGERLAELRVMMNRNNDDGIQLALQEFEKEAKDVASDLSDAGAKGRVNTELISSINNKLGEERDILGVVMQTAPTGLSLKLASAREIALESKLKVASLLPDDQLAVVVDQDLEIEIDQQVLGVQTSTNSLMQKFGVLSTSDHSSSNSAVNGKDGQSAYFIQEKARLLEERKKLLAQIKVLTQQLQNNERALQQLQKMQTSLRTVPSVIPSSGYSIYGYSMLLAYGAATRTVSCPTTYEIYGGIRSKNVGTVKYHWIRSDGYVGPDQSLEFTEAGQQKSVKDTWTLGSNSDSAFKPFNGWEAIKLTDYNQTSPKAYINLTCTDSLSPTPSPTK